MTAAPALDATSWRVSTPPRPRLTLAPDLTIWQGWADDWLAALRIKNRELTQRNYLATLGRFAVFAAGRGLTDPAQVGTRDVTAFVGWLTDQPARNGQPPATSYVAQHLRQLKVFYAWWAKMEKQPTHPAADVPLPKADDKLPEPVFTDAELSALLRTAKGSSFGALRDTALLRMLLDTGMRASELISLQLADVDTIEGLAYIRIGKGGKGRTVPLAGRTVEALTLYRRARATQPDAGLPQLWLAVQKGHGVLGVSGLAVMLKARGRQAGIVGRVHPHRFRHTAFDAMEPHVSGGAAMDLMGWKSRAMLDHYGKANREKRALDAGRKLAAGNRV